MTADLSDSPDYRPPQRMGFFRSSPGSQATRRVLATSSWRLIVWEIALILTVTFGTRGVRSVLQLIDAVLRPESLGEQSTTLNAPQSTVVWLDPLFQLLSVGTLCAWGGLAFFLLIVHQPQYVSVDRNPPRSSLALTSWRHRPSDWFHGVGLAAVIGIPGLAFYVTAVHLGLSKEVVASGLSWQWWNLLLLVLHSWANGVAEEIVVVAWLGTRLRQLGWRWPLVLIASSLLRGSYHLYQGFSAGVGNIIMGAVYFYYWRTTGRIWPLVIAHGLIDTVAFVGYALVGSPT